MTDYSLEVSFEIAERVLNLANLMDTTFTDSEKAKRAHLKLAISAALCDAYSAGRQAKTNDMAV